MPWITNVSLAAAAESRHHDPGARSMLIQLMDPGSEFPQTVHKFQEVYQYNFLDIDDTDPLFGEFAITDHDAIGIVENLRRAMAMDMNVVVHCHQGLCRSGAVVEVGVMIGLADAGYFRIPNVTVKRKLMKALGLYYD